MRQIICSSLDFEYVEVILLIEERTQLMYAGGWVGVKQDSQRLIFLSAGSIITGAK